MKPTKRISNSFIESIQINRQIPVKGFDVLGCQWAKQLVTRGDCELIRLFNSIRIIMKNDLWFHSLERVSLDEMPNGAELLSPAEIDRMNSELNDHEKLAI